MSASSALEQVVVLCGGRGLRLAPAIGDVPKVLAPVAGQPLLGHLLRDLHAAGARRVLLVAGHAADQLAEALPALVPPGLETTTFVEPEPRGTAGALRAVVDQLAERFLLVYGDVFTALDWRRFADAADEDGGLATLLVHRSSHPEDSDVVAIDDAHRVIGWLGRRPEQRQGAIVARAALTNAAIAAFDRRIVDYIPQGRASDLYSEVMPALVDARQPIHGYLTSEYVRDLGTPRRLAAVDADVRSGRAHLRAELALLDRDGVLSVESGQLVDAPSRLELLPGAAAGVRLLNQAGVRVAVVTNQAVVARGLCTQETLEQIHAELRRQLAEQGATLDAIFACPHHPETHHAEGVDALRGPCRCRKPSTGMVVDALAELGVAPWRALVVGDASIDMQLAMNSGLPAIAVDTGQAARDARYPAKPVWRFADLASAARWITNAGGAAAHAGAR